MPGNEKTSTPNPPRTAMQLFVNGLFCRPCKKTSPSTLKSMNTKKLNNDQQYISVPVEEYERIQVLLRAARDLLRKNDRAFYVEKATGTIVFYDGAECDGTCLMEEIEMLLEIDRHEPVLTEEAATHAK